MDYYIYKNDKNVGPLPENEVIDGLKSGRFSEKDLACRVGEEKWQDLGIFFPDNTYSWMDNTNTGQASSRKPPTQTVPKSDNANAQQPEYHSPIQASTAPQQQQQQVQHVVHHYEGNSDGPLPTIAMVGGIVVASLMVIGLIPRLGWLNWIVLISGSITAVICIIAIVTEKDPKRRNKAIIGLALVLPALVIGFIRLILGGGCI